VVALTPRLVPTAHGPIEVASRGAGPALLVVHGMPGDWRQARTLASDLADSARVLLVSRPGYGRTPLRSGRTPFAQAALYAALLDALSLDTAVVLGVSGGAPSSYAFAATQPHRCAGLVLVCPLRSGLMTAPPSMRRLAAVPGVWSALALAARSVDAVRRTAGRAASPDLASLTPEEKRLLADPRVLEALQVFELERARTLSGRGLRNDTLELGAMPPAWSGPAVPSLVMHGDLDAVVPLSHAEAYAEAIPGARLEVLAGLGHAVPIFARDRLASELRALLLR
jgi:pimeloyl-ACP methyl ester carboxylesterase